MQLESKTLLYDIQKACGSLEQFTSGKSREDYLSDALVRSAVERQFEIIGEAISKLTKVEQEVAEQLSEYGRIVAFRNILIHGYAVVEDDLVWDILQTALPRLHREVDALLAGGN